MTHAIQRPPKTPQSLPSQSLQQLIRNAIREAASTGMGEREIVEMSQRLIREKQGAKKQ